MLRMDPTAHTRTVLTWTPERRKKRGCPRTTWRRTVMEEMRRVAIDWERAARLAQDRVFWKSVFEDLCATGHHRIERVSE